VEINHELSATILDKIQSYPENFNMGVWTSSYNEVGRQFYDGPVPGTAEAEVNCETTFCIAGWAQLLTRGRVTSSEARSTAIPALGITTEVADDLFYCEDDEAIEALELMSKPGTTNEDVAAYFYERDRNRLSAYDD